MSFTTCPSSTLLQGTTWMSAPLESILPHLPIPTTAALHTSLSFYHLLNLVERTDCVSPISVLACYRYSGENKWYALLWGSLIVFARPGHFAVLPQNSAESLEFSAFQPWLLVRIAWGAFKKHQCPTLAPVKSECGGGGGEVEVPVWSPRPPWILMWEPLLQGGLRAHLLFHFHGQKCQKLSGSTRSRKMSFSWDGALQCANFLSL